MRTILFFVLLTSLAAAAQAAKEEKNPNASLAGTVVKEPGGEPLKKAILELIQSGSDSPHTYTATSDADGHFQIQDIVPGTYTLLVERTGFVAVDAKHHKNDVLRLTFERGQAVNDLLVRMLTTAVVTGRVLDEDGDPMPGANVALLRRRNLEDGQANQVIAERTNDLGQYRLSGVLPGHYLVAVTPPVTIESVLNSPKDKESATTVDLAYVTTYYPNTIERAQASPIELRAGDEMPLNVSLVRAPTTHIRGMVANLSPGASAHVILQPIGDDLNFQETEVAKDGKFDLRNVAPGSYGLVAVESINDKTLVARQTQSVNGANIEGVRLVPLPDATVRGLVRVPENPRFDFSQIGLLLHPSESETLNLMLRTNSSLKPDGSFEWKDVPVGSYYIDSYATGNSTTDYYLESITVGGRDIRDSRLVVSGTPLSLDVLLSPNGARLEGTVLDDHDQPVANAAVIAVPPEALRTRPDRFGRTLTDQRGRFSLRGLVPGEYSLFAWEALEKGDFLDATFLKSYQEHAVSVHLEKGEQAHVSLKLLPAPED